MRFSNNSIVNFVFPNINGNFPNLDIIKTVDEKNSIILMIITNRIIKKGNTLFR